MQDMDANAASFSAPQRNRKAPPTLEQILYSHPKTLLVQVGTFKVWAIEGGSFEGQLAIESLDLLFIQPSRELAGFLVEGRNTGATFGGDGQVRFSQGGGSRSDPRCWMTKGMTSITIWPQEADALAQAITGHGK